LSMNNLNVSIFVESETQWIFNKTTCLTSHENRIRTEWYDICLYTCAVTIFEIFGGTYW
jgi:hypothetical protein